jgi:hypothetical protein
MPTREKYPTCSIHTTVVLDRTDSKFGPVLSCPVPGCTVVLYSGKTSTPADKYTRKLRRTCHEAFDKLYPPPRIRGVRPSRATDGKRKIFLSRSSAYAWLAKFMRVPKERAHIGMFDATQCQRLLMILIGPDPTNGRPDPVGADGFHFVMDGRHLYERDPSLTAVKHSSEMLRGRDVPYRLDPLPYLAYADLLQDHDDPRADGYRALAALARRPYGYVRFDGQPDWAEWYDVDADDFRSRSRVDPYSDLPRVWYRAIVSISPDEVQRNGGRIQWFEEGSETGEPCDRALRCARDAAARAWILLAPTVRDSVRRVLQSDLDPDDSE